MKKLFALFLSLTLIFSLSSSALAKDSAVSLTENQKNILRAYGLTDKEIEKVDLQTIRNVLRTGGVIKQPSDPKTVPILRDNIPEDVKIKLKEKGITPSQAKSLENRGFTYDQILTMDSATVQTIVSPMITMPSDYVYVEIPEGGGWEWLHPDAANNLTLFVSDYRQGGSYIFSESNTANFRYNYYIYGEFDSSIGTHEGVDLQDTANYSHQVRSVTPGVVIGKDVSGYGTLQIYDSYLNETITYMHMTSIQKNIGDTVSVGDYIGNQGSVGAYANHLHFQAVDGNNTYIPSGRDNNLESRQPGGFLIWYI